MDYVLKSHKPNGWITMDVRGVFYLWIELIKVDKSIAIDSN